MSEQNNKKTGFGLGQIIVIVIVLVCIFNFFNGSDKNNEKEQNINISSYSTDSASLVKLFKNTAKYKVDNVKAEYNDVFMSYTITYDYMDSVWDNADFVRKALSDYINYCQYAFKIPGIDCVSFEINTNMTDERGNVNMKNVMSIRMTKKAFSAYSWENMEYRSGLYSNFQRDSDFFWVYPGIAATLDDKNIYYVK